MDLRHILAPQEAKEQIAHGQWRHLSVDSRSMAALEMQAACRRTLGKRPSKHRDGPRTGRITKPCGSRGEVPRVGRVLLAELVRGRDTKCKPSATQVSFFLSTRLKVAEFMMANETPPMYTEIPLTWDEYTSFSEEPHERCVNLIVKFDTIRRRPIQMAPITDKVLQRIELGKQHGVDLRPVQKYEVYHHIPEKRFSAHIMEDNVLDTVTRRFFDHGRGLSQPYNQHFNTTWESQKLSSYWTMEELLHTAQSAKRVRQDCEALLERITEGRYGDHADLMQARDRCHYRQVAQTVLDSASSLEGLSEGAYSLRLVEASWLVEFSQSNQKIGGDFYDLTFTNPLFEWQPCDNGGSVLPY